MLIFGLIQWFCLHVLEQHHPCVSVRNDILAFCRHACVNNAFIILLDIHSQRVKIEGEGQQKPQQAAGVKNFTI